MWTFSPIEKDFGGHRCGTVVWTLWGHHLRYVQHSCFMYYNTIPNQIEGGPLGNCQ